MTAPQADAGPGTVPAGFSVHLDVFEGPFDLLLALIAKHRLDITEVALSQVTDEFIGYLRQRGPDWELDSTTEFLVVAATLLDLKAARLLPAGEVADEEDVALLEARDLLFARLLQYRAYKQVAARFEEWLAVEATRFARAVPLEQRYVGLLPDVVLGVDPHGLAALAAAALATPPAPPQVSLAHLHQPAVSVREQAVVVAGRLSDAGTLSFRALTRDCPSTAHLVARFLALLELFRERLVAFEQVAPLGDLLVRWIGTGQPGDVSVTDEFDVDPVAPVDGAAAALR